jgi:hypothetical protein
MLTRAFIKQTLLVGSTLFLFFLLGRFAGLTYLPSLRYLNIALLIIPVSAGFLKRDNSFLSSYREPVICFFSILISCLLFDLLLFWYLSIDSWFSEFLNFYSQSVLGVGDGLKYVFLFEAFQFAVIVSIVSAVLKVCFTDNSYTTH